MALFIKLLRHVCGALERRWVHQANARRRHKDRTRSAGAVNNNLLEHCLPESEALERVVDTHIYNLRKKLEAAGISGVLVNVRGVGYRFRQP